MIEESQYLLVYSLFHDSFFNSSLIELTRGHLWMNIECLFNKITRNCPIFPMIHHAVLSFYLSKPDMKSTTFSLWSRRNRTFLLTVALWFHFYFEEWIQTFFRFKSDHKEAFPIFLSLWAEFSLLVPIIIHSAIFSMTLLFIPRLLGRWLVLLSCCKQDAFVTAYVLRTCACVPVSSS